MACSMQCGLQHSTHLGVLRMPQASRIGIHTGIKNRHSLNLLVRCTNDDDLPRRCRSVCWIVPCTGVEDSGMIGPAMIRLSDEKCRRREMNFNDDFFSEALGAFENNRVYN